MVLLPLPPAELLLNVKLSFSRLQSVAVVGEPIKHRGHLKVAENVAPVAAAQDGGDRHTGPLAQLGEQLNQQGATRLAERWTAKLVQGHKLQAQQAIGELARKRCGGDGWDLS